MRARTLAALMAVLLLSWPVAAQEQRGSIEGTVKDASGAVLPGATVEAKTTTGAVLSATTDASGGFRFPSLAPGVYEVTATLASFAPQKFADVTVGLGQIKRLEFGLALAGVAEVVSVTAESPIVDVKQSARQTNIRAEQLTLLPKGRDYLSLVTQAPGANYEAKSNGFMIDGATASENRYIIDGVETTDLRNGTSGQMLIAEFVEEVQVKSSGYTAEYAGSTGGVISAITKSGANRFSGNALFNWQGSSLAGNVPTLRTNLADATKSEYITYPKDDANRVEPGFALGGPIVVNKAWFFGAYQPALTTTDRTVDPSSSNNPAALTISQTEKRNTQFLSSNVSGQFGEKLRVRGAFNNSWSKVKGLLPSLNGTDPSDGIDVNYLKTSTFPNWTLSGTMDYVVSPKLFVGVRGGYYLSDQNDTQVPDTSRYLWTTTSNVGFVGTNGVPVPANLQHGTNFTSVISNLAVERDKLTRPFFQADATWFVRAGGEHQIKGGVQWDRRANDVFLGEVDHRVTFRWGSSLSGVRGPFGYYSVRSAVDTRVDPSRYGGAAEANALRKNGFVTTGNIKSNVVGLFIQDAWSVSNRLTINAGLRTEQESVPIYGEVPGIEAKPIEFGFGQKLAPRLGFAYDVKGDGRTKVYGSWGIFYDIFKLELPRGSYGGDKWTEYYYTLDTPDWTTVNTADACPPACSGTLLRVTDFRLPTYSVNADDCLSQGCTDPNLDPMKSQELSFGFERQFGTVWAGSVRYIHKQIDKAIEDIGTITAEGNEAYVIGNPGYGPATIAHLDPTVEMPKAKRDYDGVEFALDKRFSNNWYLRASYLWSRLDGNYPGLAQTDENGRTSPNVGRLYDYPLMMFMDGGEAVFGRLPTDRPHQFKSQFIYRFPIGTSIGVNEYVASGLPVTRELGVYPTSNLPVQYLGRMSDGRTDVLSQTDLLVQHEFNIGGNRRLQLSFNVLNLFDQEASVSRFSTYQAVNGVVPNEVLFYNGQQTLESLITPQGVQVDPRFLRDNAFQPPLQARFGVKFSF
jgi:Carboxypeptidase regulatory-like domain/TonB dependent receptor-like, beta-barrel